MLERARACRKPVVVCFLDRGETPVDEQGLQFARGTKEAATDHFLRLTQNICRALHCLFGVEGNEIIATTLYWLTRTILQVDVTVTETTTVAEEVVVYRTVVTVFDTTQFAVTFTGKRLKKRRVDDKGYTV